MHPKMLEIVGGDEAIYPHRLEKDFSRIFNKVVELWGSEKLDEFLNGLFLDDKGGRQGFPREVMREIFALSRLNDASRAASAAATPPWETENARRGLKELGVEFSRPGFFHALQQGNDAAVQLFLRGGYNVDVCDENGWTPLMIALFVGRESTAKLLIRHGASATACDPQGYGPMHWAALQGFAGVVDLLMERGASADVQSLKGITPLIQAAAGGHAAAIRMLLDKRASVNLPDNEGWTPLHKAVANGHTEAARILLGAGADAQARHRDGLTPADIARAKGRPEMLRLFGLS